MTESIDRVPLRFEYSATDTSALKLTVTVPQIVATRIYQEAIATLQKNSSTYGFLRGETPAEYIAHNFAVQLRNHVHDFTLNYFVLPFLHQAIREHKLLVTGLPELIDAQIGPEKDSCFTFCIAALTPISIKEWKYLPFKAPHRKKYKDLDRQAEQFIKSELELEKELIDQAIKQGDWVHLKIAPATDAGVPLFGTHSESFWIKIGNDEIDAELYDSFINTSIGQETLVVNEHIQNYFCNRSHIPITFIITVADIIHSSFFCFEQFKKSFKLKSKREMQQKLIEVFSYQHDMSQRRAMAERSIALLLSKNKFEIPHQLFAEQQRLVLQAVRHNPDYHVYRTQKDFQKRIEQLAKKQAAESLLLDQIAYYENIVSTYQDIRAYFNFLKRPRTKEFIYFNPPITKINGQESLLYQQELATLTCREKTLNYIIHYLTRT